MTKRPRRTRPPTRRTPPPPSAKARAADGDDVVAAPLAAPGGSGPVAPRPTRVARRQTRTTRRVEQRSVWDRYRGLLLGAFALLGAGIIGFVFFQSASGAAYTCGPHLTPGPVASAPTPAPTFRETPTPSPSPSASAAASPVTSAPGSASPGASPSASITGSASPSASASASTSPSASASASAPPSAPLGFPTEDEGADHVRPGTAISYAFCPPTSGVHYEVGPQAPLRRAFYGPDTETRPGSWVHNLEHGWIVLAYRGGAEGATTEELAQIRAFFESAPPSTFPNSCQSPNKLLPVRFDAMDTKFALLAWDRALLTDTFDADQALTFYQQHVDSLQAPERGAC